MAEHGRANRAKQEPEGEQKRTRRRDSERIADPVHARDEGNLTIGETPFRPPVEKHRTLLSMARSAEGRAGIVLQLQRTYGNRYVERLLKTMRTQAMLTVNPPDDVYEQEADRVADAVTRTLNARSQRQPLPEEEELIQGKSRIQRQLPEEEEELLQGKSLVQRQPEEEEELQMEATGSSSATVSEELETRINAARGSGQPLSEGVRESMEQAFRADFSGVRVHNDSEAHALNRELSARAFTTGQDIFFREGEYSPGSNSGQKLIAHELTHVVQQTGVKGPQRQEEVEKKLLQPKADSIKEIGASKRRVAKGEAIQRVLTFTSPEWVQLPEKSAVQQAVIQAFERAKVIIERAEVGMGAAAADQIQQARCRQWFGILTQAQRDQVRDNLRAIRSALNRNYLIRVDLIKTPHTDFAYVLLDQPYLVFICNAFIQSYKQAATIDSTAGAIIHELSHLSAGTLDHGYGRAQCMAFANTNVNLAITNADNHEYYCEDFL
jgi:hypothetical protein